MIEWILKYLMGEVRHGIRRGAQTCFFDSYADAAHEIERLRDYERDRESVLVSERMSNRKYNDLQEFGGW